MINSMTGYGSVEGHIGQASYIVEIKTLNSRYFKTKIKLPDVYSCLEEEIEKLLRKDFVRGTVNLSLSVKNAACESAYEIDKEVLKRYIDGIKDSAKASGLELAIDAGNLISAPGVLRQVEIEDSFVEEIKDQIINIVKAGIKKVIEMRKVEGATLAKDLQGHCKIIENLIDEVKALNESLPNERQKMLEEKLNDLLSVSETMIDQVSLSREVAILADKMDIAEELTRLESHIEQFGTYLQKGGQLGRRLDFLTQEMLREANTMASKTPCMEIIHKVVDIKCSIEKIKEQVQNIE